MITHCKQCLMYFDDEFRSTLCPHQAFPANDGNNNFAVYEDAYLSNSHPTDKQAYEDLAASGGIVDAP